MRRATRRSTARNKKSGALALVLLSILAIGLFAGHAGFARPGARVVPPPFFGAAPLALPCGDQNVNLNVYVNNGALVDSGGYAGTSVDQAGVVNVNILQSGYPCSSYPYPYQPYGDPCGCQAPAPYLPVNPYPTATPQPPDVTPKPTKASTHGGKPPKATKASKDSKHTKDTRDTKNTRDTGDTRGSRHNGGY